MTKTLTKNMTKEEKSKRYKEYMKMKRTQGMLYRSFFVPVILVDDVKQFIKARSLQLSLTLPPQKKV